MRKKQYSLLGLLSFLLLAGGLHLPAQAQEKEKAQAGAPKKAKVKIFRQEGDTYYVLDTTLTIPAGTSMGKALEKLQADSASFKKLGAKPLSPVRISAGKLGEVIKVVPSQGRDSLRTMVFRLAAPDSVFSRNKEIRVYGATTLGGDSLRRTRVRAFTLRGNPTVVHRAITIDSLVNPRIFRIDSTFSLSGDSLLGRETIRVLKEEGTEGITIRRLRKKDTGEVIEPGDYDVVKLRRGDNTRIILLQEAKATINSGEKQAAKGRKKKEAQKAAKLELRFFPNPTSGPVTYSFTSPKKAKAQVRVVDNLGKTVHQEDLGTVEGTYFRELNLTRLGKGTYTIQVIVGKTTQAGKVVVQ
ncbi:T9SS type A sorting domain-containing protein [Rufibacter glacialis]|uniref:T9SS type A sorting domain-containing protein n=1 Tax=Rufibacter glacialis TaxID=1259555 RepID=A0A5M8QHT2_9BACT|nr:T9SS type A sorting domain-containing protein [Rufibacter glacialis]KAA6434534.1 T9SS type A sorting domain-containing protein [Rufibacter glacialis]GGK70425.1 hypothetical protein GCM10011405_18140 [Rufibacter glacialis]